MLVCIHLNISLKLILLITHLPIIMQLKKYKLINSDIMTIERCDPAFVSMHLKKSVKIQIG